jgi:hypothetical protein
VLPIKPMIAFATVEMPESVFVLPSMVGAVSTLLVVFFAVFELAFVLVVPIASPIENPSNHVEGLKIEAS